MPLRGDQWFFSYLEDSFWPRTQHFTISRWWLVQCFHFHSVWINQWSQERKDLRVSRRPEPPKTRARSSSALVWTWSYQYEYYSTNSSCMRVDRRLTSSDDAVKEPRDLEYRLETQGRLALLILLLFTLIHISVLRQEWQIQLDTKNHRSTV